MNDGALAQLVEHLPGRQGVRGSNPLGSTTRNPLCCKGFRCFLDQPRCTNDHGLEVEVGINMASTQALPVRTYASTGAGKSPPPDGTNGRGRIVSNPKQTIAPTKNSPDQKSIPVPNPLV